MTSKCMLKEGVESTLKRATDNDWERKQRLREYRVAARREKRNRKSDEKKQRKLNATILRRMATKNPDKYNRNAERNRLRDIEAERRKIWMEAIKQAQRLAIIHDPTGSAFNVAPVVKQNDGTVISVEALQNRQVRAAAAITAKGDVTASSCDNHKGFIDQHCDASSRELLLTRSGIHPQRLMQIDAERHNAPCKTQEIEVVPLEPRLPPPRPVIPDFVSIPDGEKDWIQLWDLDDQQLEKRVIRERNRKAAERKALRLKQQDGKVERRASRDEKRRSYREIKLTWKSIKEEQVKEKTKLKAMEEEESKKIAVEVNTFERQAALDCCTNFGFTIFNTAKVDEVNPRALGMKGVDVDFSAIRKEMLCKKQPKTKIEKVDLGTVPINATMEVLPTSSPHWQYGSEDFVKLDVGDGADFESLNYNHRLRRKLRKAIEDSDIRKEMLVRQRALNFCLENGLEPPTELKSPSKPRKVKGQMILVSGALETAKQERVRARTEVVEYNKAAKVLRKQAKQIAVEAGLRKHAELTGKLSSQTPPNGTTKDTEPL